MDPINIDNGLKNFLNEQLNEQLLDAAPQRAFLPQFLASSQKIAKVFDALSIYFGFLDPETFDQIMHPISKPNQAIVVPQHIQLLHQYAVRNGFVGSETHPVAMSLSHPIGKQNPYTMQRDIPLEKSEPSTKMHQIFNALNGFSHAFYYSLPNLFNPSAPLSNVLFKHCAKRLFTMYANHLSSVTPRAALVACCADCYTVMACIQHYGQQWEDLCFKKVIDHRVQFRCENLNAYHQNKKDTFLYPMYSDLALRTLISDKEHWLSLTPTQLRQQACVYASNAFLHSLDNQEMGASREYALWTAHHKTLYPHNLIPELFNAVATDAQLLQQLSNDILSHPLEKPILNILSATKACFKPFAIKHSQCKNDIYQFVQFLTATQLLEKVFSPLLQELDQCVTKDTIESLEAQTLLRTFTYQSSLPSCVSNAEPNGPVLPLLCAAQLIKFREQKNKMNGGQEGPVSKMG